MLAQTRKISLKLISVWVILGMLFPLFAQPLQTLASPKAVPSNCTGEAITLVEGEANVTIENPTITNVSVNGCNVSGSMRIVFRGNNKGGILISGSVDAFDNFQASSVGYFELDIAGLTLKAYNSTYTTDNDGALRITRPNIKIPDAWGGLEAQIPSTTQLDKGGLQIARFKLPSLKTQKGFVLDLSGQLRMASTGYELDADGSLSLPDIGKTSGCAISAGVTLYASVLGQGVIEIHTPEGAQAASLRSNRSTIRRPDGLASLVPAHLAVNSYYLPVPSDLPPDAWLQGEPETPQALEAQSSPVANARLASSMAMVPPYAVTGEQAVGPSFIPPGEEEAVAAGQAYDWALWEEGNYAQPLLSSADFPEQELAHDAFDSAMIGPLEKEDALSPEALELREIRASASCSKGIPIANTGFELTGVNGVISLRPNSQFVQIGVTIESSIKVASYSALKLDAYAKFQWNPEFAGEIGGALYVLTMFKVAEAKVSLSESDGFRTTVWMRGFVWEITVSIHAWTRDQRFHFTGSGQARIGMGKGQIWQGCIPYPCGVRWCYKMVWKVKIWYPCGVQICDGCISVPPIDLWLGGLGADFGEFTGGVYGFKAYVSFAGYTTGVFVNHKGDVKFGDVSGYRLIGTMQLAQAYQAWQTARLSNRTSFAGDDTFTFLSDDKVLVHFDLPMADRYRVPLSVSDAITPVNVITQTDTIFSVKSDTPLDVSLISPEGITITVDNYDQSPGGYVIGYRQIVTYTLERATSTGETVPGSKEEEAKAQTRWRFIPVSSDPIMEHVDVTLDNTAVFTDVWITDTKRIDYAFLEPGTHTIAVMPSGSAEEILTATLDAITGTAYTVLAIGVDPTEALILEDDNRKPDDFGAARVRAVNAVSPTLPITVSLGDWNMPLAYGQAGEYLTVPAGEYAFSVPANAATQPTQTAALDNLSVITLTGAPGDYFGNAIASAGDVNGDGYDDILIGAWGYDGDAGLVHLYYGNMTSIASIPITLTGATEGYAFGTSVSSAGDVNGDGYADVIIGAMGAAAAYIYYGSAQGLSTEPDVVLYGESEESYGSSVATAGDINGDGFADVLVAADGWNGSIGRVYGYMGSAAGLATTPAVTLTGEGLPGGDLGGAEFGAAIGTAGDINNDGYSDIIIGADGYEGFTGAALVYYGSPAGDLITYTLLTGAAPMDNFGWAAGTAGDVNNDGYDDVIVGAYGAAPFGDYWSGGAYVYHGGPDGLSTTPTMTLTGHQSGDYFGIAVGAAGDVDNDGYDDVIVGASLADGEKGQAYLYLGSAEGIEAGAVLTLTEDIGHYGFGYEVATAGDVNGDGYADFIVSAEDYYSGRVYVYVSPGSAPIYWLEPTTATFEEGDVQTLIFTPFGDATFPVGYLNTTDERYKVMTETQFIVDQAIAGTWSVQLVGDTSGQLIVGAIAATNPPIISDLTVDASTLAQTKVAYRLLSDYLPVTIGIYANNGPITETMVVTESIGATDPVTTLKEIPLYAGTAVYTITLTNENAVKGEIVTETVDLSWLESGNYTLWVRAEDGVNPPVQGYVWSTPTQARAAGLHWALNQVRVAAEGYDPLAQLAGAININIDQTTTFTDHWTTVITPTVNPRFITRDDQGELVETLIDGLFVEFTPNTHPDVDSYVVHVTDLANTFVITTGLTTAQLYDALGNPVGGPINYVVFNGINPKTTYSIVIAAIDWDSGLTSWSNAHVTTVPLGDFGMLAQTPVLTVTAGQEVVSVTLVLTQTSDLFADISLYLDSQHLPGIRLKSLAYEYVGMAEAVESSWLSIPAVMRMPAAVRAASTADISTILAHVEITVPTTIVPGIYTLPFRGYSGELQREATVNMVVGEPQQTIIPPDATEPVVVVGDLPLPSCAQAVTVTIPPGSFAVTSTFEFRQGTNNVTHPDSNYQFANVRFFLSAFTYPESVAIGLLKPISLTLHYDEACLVGLHEDRLRLLTLAAPQVWSGADIACTIDAQHNRLDCGLDNLGEFALFEYTAKIYLPLVLK